MNGKFKLNPELKLRWITALRSGKYVQGTGYLRDINNNYCCLGVLADILDPEGWVPKPEHSIFQWKPELCEDQYLGRFSNKYLTNGPIPADIQRALAKKNDFYKKSFLEIAEYIEDNL